MATFEELMAAAGRADKAGDTSAARTLVQEAIKVRGAVPEGPAQPPAAPGGAGYTFPGTPDTPYSPGDTIANVTSGPRQQFGAFAASLTGQGPSPTAQALPGYLGYDKPEDMPAWVKTALWPVPALGDAAGLALSGIGAGLAAGAGAVGELAPGNSTAKEQLAGELLAASQFAVPELAGVSSASLSAGKVARTGAPEAPATAAMREMGVTPSLGMRGKTGGLIAAGLEKLPSTAAIVAKDASRATGQIQDAFKAAVSRAGIPTGTYAAGEKLQAGLKTYVEMFQKRAGAMFDRVDQQIPASTRMDLPNTQSAVAAGKQFFADNPELAQRLGLNNWDAIMAEVGKNGISWQAAKQFRTDVGAALNSQRGSLGDETVGRLKQLYGALSADMEATARAAGPEAYGTWKTATNFYKNGATRIDEQLDKTISVDNPERAFEAFDAMTKADRSSADITRLRNIKASIAERDWNDISASIVDRMGKATAGAQGADGGAFSANTFLTKWNQMAPEAKRLLLPPEAREAMDKVALIAEKAKAANMERNVSNTGSATAMLATGTGLATAPASTITALALSALSAKALTSPAFMNALTAFGKGNARALQAMAQSSGPFAKDAASVLRMTAAEAAQPQGPANSDAAPMMRAVQ